MYIFLYELAWGGPKTRQYLDEYRKYLYFKCGIMLIIIVAMVVQLIISRVVILGISFGALIMIWWLMVSVFVLQCWVAADYELSLVSSFCQDLFLSRSTTIYDGATSADQTLMMIKTLKPKSRGSWAQTSSFWHYRLVWLCLWASCVRQSRIDSVTI